MKIVIVFLSMTLGMSCGMDAMHVSRKQIRINTEKAVEKARARKNSTSTSSQSPRSPHTLSAAGPVWPVIDGTIIPSQNSQNK